MKERGKRAMAHSHGISIKKNNNPHIGQHSRQMKTLQPCLRKRRELKKGKFKNRYPPDLFGLVGKQRHKNTKEGNCTFPTSQLHPVAHPGKTGLYPPALIQTGHGTVSVNIIRMASGEMPAQTTRQ